MNLTFLFLLIAVILAVIASVQPSAGPINLLALSVAFFAAAHLV